jgi:hypothetical protein
MSDQLLALFLTLGLLILMVAWVPFLDFLRRIVRRFRERLVAHSSIIQAVTTDER